MALFKAYDIRGIYNQDIDQATAFRIGLAFGKFYPGKTLLVGYDARRHSRELYHSLIQGLQKAGKQVSGTGLVSTPQLHYAQIAQAYDGGIMSTASHNPPQYQGFKFFDRQGGCISYVKGLNKVEAIFNAIKDKPGAAVTIVERSFLDEYIEFLMQATQGGVKQTVSCVIDISNGSAGAVFTALTQRLGIQARIINREPDGNFPNHNPNPLEEASRLQIKAEVQSSAAQFGAILDGDGDRIIFIDEKGEAIESYFIACLIAEELLKTHHGAAVVYDLISSRVLGEHISALGGKPIASKVGYTFLYDKMVHSRAVFGSEASGHVYFKVNDNYYTESAAYAFVVLAKLITQKERPLSELVRPFQQKYFQIKEINLPISDKKQALKLIAQRYRRGKIDKTDGISVAFPDYWFNVRASNTEPILRLRLEARSEKTARVQAAELTALLEKKEVT